MTYLLGQILLCILLAALAGWFIGWSWRGFREQDRVEDLRRTLRATEEVKDRDLSETQRREDALKSRVEVLERRCEKLADELSTTRRAPPSQSEAPHGALSLSVASGGADGDRSLGEAAAAANESGQSVAFSVEGAEIQALRDKLSRIEDELEQERRQRRDVEEALRDKTGAVLSLQAELTGLRAGTQERAEAVARLERRLVELEPLEERLRSREEELRDVRGRLHEATRERGSDEDRTRELDRQSAALEEQLRQRDRRLNEIRNDYNDAVARLEALESERDLLRRRVQESETEHDDVVRYQALAAQAPDLEERLSDCSRRLQQVEGQLQEARSALQRQIERNRKQETVHQQVVANLREELRDRAGTTVSAPPAPPPNSGATTEQARWRQVVAHRDSNIAGLRNRIVELEEELSHASPTDDLKKIRGIGPKLEDLLHSFGVTSFRQIASWDDRDVERIGERLGVFKGRVRRDGWIEGARRQYLLKYGHEPDVAAD